MNDMPVQVACIEKISNVIVDVLVEQQVNLSDVWNDCFGCEPCLTSTMTYDDDWQEIYDEFLCVADAEYFEGEQAIFEAWLESEKNWENSLQSNI